MKSSITIASAETLLHDGQPPTELPGYSLLHCCGFLSRQFTHIVTLSDSNSETEYENTQEDVAVILKILQCFDRDRKRQISKFSSV